MQDWLVLNFTDMKIHECADGDAAAKAMDHFHALNKDVQVLLRADGGYAMFRPGELRRKEAPSSLILPRTQLQH